MSNSEDLVENIDHKYVILEKKGFGLTANVFLVKNPENEKMYAAKVLKKKDDLFDKEIEILKNLKNNNNQFIVNLIESGNGDITRKNHPIENKQYLILEYASKGELFNYVYCYKQGFKEKYSKVIFAKILRGVLSCHKAGICHRDLKMQNILLDENFNPKICDFGFATFNTGKLTEPLGTRNYAAPEIFLGRPYDGFKADIFSLGVVLLTLVTCKIGFGEATKNDPYYRLIMTRHYLQYWNVVGNQIKGVSEEFKQLYNKMISFRAQDRPTIEDILSSDWMKEIRELNEDQLKELENEIREEMMKREVSVKQKMSEKVETEGESSGNVNYNRGGGDDGKDYFDLSLKPKYAKTGINMNNFIKIKGDLPPAKFMNNLANKIKEDFGDNCNIAESKKALKFNITFEEELKDEEEIPKELEEELAQLDLGDNEDGDDDILRKKDCVIQCKLYKSIKEGYILRFTKKDGELEDYYKNVEKITDLVKSVL